MKNTDLDLVFIIDRSGSMHRSEEDTIGGFNSFIEKEMQNEYTTKVTTVLFDNKYEMLYERKSIDEVEKLTKEQYYVRGSTALLDAIGMTITTLDKKIENKVLCVIMTDGAENSSKEYNREQIKNLINSHTWEFIYIGADIDSYAEARQYGFKDSNIANYEKSDEGIRRAYTSITNASESLRHKKHIGADWKDSLKEYD